MTPDAPSWLRVLADRRRREQESRDLAARVLASAASDGVDAMQELDCLRSAMDDRRSALVAALDLPPETTWDEAIARVTPIAKGCHGCRFSDGDACRQIGPHGSAERRTRLSVRLLTWIDEYTSDYHTPTPGAPECPGREPA